MDADHARVATVHRCRALLACGHGDVGIICRQDASRNPDEIEITLMAAAPSLEAVKRLQNLSADRAIMRAPASEAEALRAGMEKIADEIIAKL
ncbi:MAG: hypothetical protein ACREQX_05135 [Candidatus Binataceae bacterium]